MKKLTILFLLNLCWLGTANAGINTEISAVGRVSYSITTQTITIYTKGGGNWIGDCSIVQVALGTTYPGVKELLSIVLTAKATGIEVRFFGDCNSNGHFTAHSVYLP